jgi:hypothetical protein
MESSMFTRTTCLIGVLLLAACAGRDAVPRDWLGRWPGPEGTWLDISLADGNYTLTIMNLDATRSFPAAAAGGGLSFQRDGVRESLRATDGAGTGMKWLAGKTTCLVVRPGEGFCRD